MALCDQVRLNADKLCYIIHTNYIARLGLVALELIGVFAVTV